jgi:CheY-like chemotaxis protein
LTAPIDSELPRHHAYVLRLWETRSLPPDPTSQWRFSLEDLRGPGDHKFGDLKSLTAFLEKVTGQGTKLDPGDETRVEDALPEAESMETEGDVVIAFNPAETLILLVEEDQAIRRSVSLWLRRTLPDATVVGADSDESAEALARSRSPDVILVDVAPPKEDGTETVRRLHASAPSARIVALTMEEPKARRDALMAAGANTCIRIWELRRELVSELNELLTSGREDLATGTTVVCIEDEIDMLSLIKFTLERHDINLVTAMGGEEGLQAVRQTNPDLVLLDLMMPGVDGVEVYETLRQHEETKDIPVIVLTVLDPGWVENRGMDLTGIADYVTKPFAPQDLADRVGKALKVVA